MKGAGKGQSARTDCRNRSGTDLQERKWTGASLHITIVWLLYTGALVVVWGIAGTCSVSRSFLSRKAPLHSCSDRSGSTCTRWFPIGLCIGAQLVCTYGFLDACSYLETATTLAELYIESGMPDKVYVCLGLCLSCTPGRTSPALGLRKGLHHGHVLHVLNDATCVLRSLVTPFAQHPSRHTHAHTAWHKALTCSHKALTCSHKALTCSHCMAQGTHMPTQGTHMLTMHGMLEHRRHRYLKSTPSK